MAHALDAPYLPLGSEFRVNSRIADENHDGGINSAPAISRDPFGNFVVSWNRYESSGASNVYARRYSAAGRALGPELRVDTGAQNAGYYSDVGMDRRGNFTVVWRGDFSDGRGSGLLARQFSLLGPAKGGPLLTLVPRSSNEIPSGPQMAMQGQGDFVVVWETFGGEANVYGQLFDSSGRARSALFKVNASGRSALGPGVAINERGDFVVVWVGSPLVESDVRDVFAQRYDPSGQPVGGAIPVATVTQEIQEAPDVAIRADGQFVVTWTTWARESELPDIVFQRFAADGSKLGVETQVNQSDWGNQRDSSISMDANGRFVISWSSNGDPKGIFARWYDALGNPQTGDTTISTSGFGRDPAGTSVDADGDLLFAWFDVKQNTSGSYQNIIGRRYSGPEDVDIGAVLTTLLDTVSAGANFELELSVLNKHVGDLNAAVGTSTGASVQLSFPAEAPLQSISGEGWTCDEPTGTSVRCTLDDVLDADAVAPKLKAVLKAPSSEQKITPRLMLNGQQFDSNAANRSDKVSISVKAGDRTPDAFSFPSQMGVAPDVLATSASATISGIDVVVPISVSDGEYQINDRPWKQTAGTVSAGSTVRVRHPSAAQALGTKTTTLTVGSAAVTFVSRTVAADTDAAPDAFSFADKQNVPLSTTVSWPPFILRGTNGGAAIRVSGPASHYQVNGGAWTTLSSTVYPGDEVRVRQTSAATGATRQTGTLQIGTFSASFSSVTLAVDTTPDAFAFSAQTGVPMGSTRTSNMVTISGIEAASPVSVIGGEYSLGCSGSFVSTSGSISNGQSVCVRHAASASENTTVTTTLTVGGVSAGFSSTTLTVDTQPDAYDFVDQNRVARNTAITSNTVTISGINTSSSISVSGSGVSYSINGGAFTSAAGMVSNGAQVRLRMTSSSSFNTKSTATVTIGGVSDTWSVTTAPLL